MRIKPYLLLISVFCVFQLPLLAANWHPFPFKAAYYGRKVSFGLSGSSPGWNANALSKGYVIEGLYLDSSYQEANQIIKKRSSGYPTLDFSISGGSLNPKIKNARVSTSADSQTVIANFNSTVDLSRSYFPANIKVGEQAISGGGIVVSKSFTMVLGILDSVATINLGSDFLLWSKTFGILIFKTFGDNGDINWLELKGVKDLNLGWQDLNYKISEPSIGDEFHFLNVKYGGINCVGNPNPPTYYSTFNTIRTKVISVGPSGVNISVISSLPGSNTGIEYGAEQNYSESNLIYNLGDSIQPAGVMGFPTQANGVISSYMGWLDSTGFSLKIYTQEVIDLTPMTLFLPCVKMPYGAFQILASTMFPTQCPGSVVEFQYPTYVKAQGKCEFGTPFPPVTITNTSDLKRNEPTVKIIPQPAQNEFRFEGISSGNFILFDAQGKASLKGEVSQNQINISGLSPGFYFYSVVSESGKSHFGKFWKQ